MSRNDFETEGFTPNHEGYRYRVVEEILEANTRAVIEIIKRIPKGKVCTYGRIALIAGQPGGARQVARVLHSMSRKYNLPWHRIINAKGHISLPEHNGYEQQKALLQHEGIQFDEKDRVDLKRYLWKGVA